MVDADRVTIDERGNLSRRSGHRPAGTFCRGRDLTNRSDASRVSGLVIESLRDVVACGACNSTIMWVNCQSILSGARGAHGCCDETVSEATEVYNAWFGLFSLY